MPRGDGNAASGSAVQAAPRAVQLDQRLKLLRQGDVITLGATNIVGRGPSATVDEASPGAKVGEDQVWTLTLVSELGYYVVLSQDCDIVRSVDIEPCLLVCPLEAVTFDRWEELRRGPYSPREFPVPESDLLDLPEGSAAIVNLRFVTSLDKEALLTSAFQQHPVLRSAALRERFATWLARRAARAPHPDDLETDVLAAAGDRVRQLAKQAARTREKGGGGLSPAQMLVSAAEEWFLAPGEQLVPMQLIVSAASAKASGLWDDNANTFNSPAVERARQQLQADLTKRCTPGLGYAVTIEVHSLDKVPAATYRSWSEWTWDNEPAWTPGDLA
jgi:hypothetical protein